MLLVFVQAYLIKKAGLIGVDELASMEILLVIFGFVVGLKYIFLQNFNEIFNLLP